MQNAMQELWEKAPEAAPDHPYLIDKRIEYSGTRQDRDALIVPASSGGNIQGIQFISSDGSTRYAKGSKITGACFKIGEFSDKVVICRDFATGATVHAATGYAVLVAFEESNIKNVVKIARRRLPGKHLIIASDSSFYKKAVKLGADSVFAPEAGETFNDQMLQFDIESVSFVLLLSKYLPPEEVEEEPPPPEDNDQPGEYCEYLPPADVDETDKRGYLDDAPFKCLGYNQGKYYYLPRGTLQVTCLSPAEHTEANLNALAQLNWWEMKFGLEKKKGADFSMARNALMGINQRVGIYNTARIRGRGAWEDEGRSVLHLGDRLVVDGTSTYISDFRSRFIYEAALQIEHDKVNTPPLVNGSAHKFVQFCDMIAWERPINGRLLAGWCVLAPICGALSWRPHIWVTGGAGTGKTWCVDNIISPMVGLMSLAIKGDTSAAGVRQELGSDALPVIYDEAEGEKPEAQKRLQDMLELARQASSESRGVILKGTTGGKAMAFNIRSMFAFASIGFAATQQADTSRITSLTLRRQIGTADQLAENFAKIKRTWAEVMTDEFCRGMRARIVRLIPVIRDNAEKFARAVAERLESQRTGDQIGALLAGAYACYSTNALSLDQAREWVNQQDWSDHVVTSEQSDERRCLNVILEHIIRVESGTEYNIAELINLAAGSVMTNNTEAAQNTLARHGIKYMQGGFAVSNTHSSIAKILEKTPWSANWGRILARLDGAVKPPQGMWISGSTSRVVMLPLKYAKEE